jgi:hypothetical protein
MGHTFAHEIKGQHPFPNFELDLWADKIMKRIRSLISMIFESFKIRV